MSAKELNIGDYVRFDYHRVTVPILIEKIVHIEYDKAEKHCFYVTDSGLVIGNENIIKSSPNIIDLIEVGDFVNGKEVLELKNFGAFNGARVFGDIYFNEEIKSIVTREMFESMKYKIGE